VIGSFSLLKNYISSHYCSNDINRSNLYLYT